MGKTQSVEPMSYVDIGNVLGVSHETVRNIEKRALAKVQANMEKQGYTLSDFIEVMEQRDDGFLDRL